jgi:hypothetical protein
MTLFFVISQNSLEIYQDQIGLESLVFSKISGDKILQLHDKFAQIWQDLYLEYISKANVLEVVISPKASFTDTRIVSIWCRSHCMFSPKVTLTIRKGQPQTQTIESKQTSEILYSQEPKIGSKTMTIL